MAKPLTITRAIQLINLMENQLGLTKPTTGESTTKWRRRHAGRMRAKAEESPNKYTPENLELAVAYMWRKRLTPLGPLSVFEFVDDALKLAPEREQTTPVEERIAEAIRFELENQLPDWDEWCSRFDRAFGAFRAEVYDEWAAERRR